jgi:hypothetical protein
MFFFRVRDKVLYQYKSKGKGKRKEALHHHDVLGSGGTAPHILTLILDGGEWSASCPSCFTPREQPLVPTGQEAGWAPEPVWTRC